jgi:hypothetical protein
MASSGASNLVWMAAIAVAGFGLLVCASPARGCYTMPQSLARPHTELIAEATQIVWAEVVSSRATEGVPSAKQPVRYKLNVLRVFKGQLESTIELDGEGGLSGIWDTTFASHSEEEFWKKPSGRMGIQGDCSMVPVLFRVGVRYLIILGGAPDTKQFERVDSQDDRWFQFIARNAAGKP